jgi:pimeloyl-ACP methyl ester carboxylesterase
VPYASSDGLKIWYEASGDPAGEPLVLLSGFGAQLIWWRDELCELLGAEGFRVIRFDNRDVGRSGRCGGPADLDGGYGLSDMAADVVAVLDAAGVERAHVAGHSMGGMIAQVFAIEHPRRLGSATFLSCIPDRDPGYVHHDDATSPMSVVQERFPREEFIAGWLDWARRGHTGDHPFDEGWVRTMAGLHHDRGYAPDGQPRQWAALLRAPGRLDALRALTAPVLVAHGRLDADLHWSAAVAMATAIEGAELLVFAGMGHELPRALWADLVAAIARTARRGAVRTAG